MENWTLITGASGGIGAALAAVAAREGRRVILAARSGDRLEALAERLVRQHGVGALTIPVDLADPDGAYALWEEATAEGRHIDVLVNNAGLGRYGRFADGGEALEQDVVAVNVVALTELTRLALPPMLHAGAGRVLQLASLAGFMPVPRMAVYAATKAYVLAFTESLAEELNGTGVSVTAVCPGVTETNFQATAGMGEIGALERRTAQTPEQVAEFAWRAMMAGRRVAVPGAANKATQLAVRTMPRRLLAWAAGRAMAR